MKTFIPKATTENQQAKLKRRHLPSQDDLSAEASDSRTSTFINYLPEAIAQRKLHAMADQSSQVRRLTQLQGEIHHGSRQLAQRKRLERLLGSSVQRQGMDDEESIQGKFDIGQPSSAVLQRLKVNNRRIDIESLMSYEVEEYLGYLQRPRERPGNVEFEPGDAEKLRNAVTILGRLQSLRRQIARNTARLVEAVGQQAPQPVANVPLEHPGVEYQTGPSTRETSQGVQVAPEGPYNLWSGTKESTRTQGGPAAGHFGAYGAVEANSGEYKAEHAPGFMMSDTREHYEAEAMLHAAEGRAHGYAQDPAFHKAFITWLEQPIEPADVMALNARDGGTRQNQQYQDNGVFKSRSFLMTEPGSRNASAVGIEYVEGELEQLRGQAGAGAERSAVETGVSAEKVSTWQNRDPTLGAHTGQTLIGLHDAHFHTAWDPTSKTTALRAARSFTPVASFGVPGHFNPTNTVQNNIEIPMLRAEAVRQQSQLNRLASMLEVLNQARRDPDVAAAIPDMRTAADDFVRGADFLQIGQLPNGWAPPNGPSAERTLEDQTRSRSRGTMEAARQILLAALDRIERSQLYKQTISKM